MYSGICKKQHGFSKTFFMQKNYCHILLILSLCATLTVKAETNLSSNQIAFKNQVETLIFETIPSASVGIALRNSKTGKLLYERHSKEPFPPASTTKVLTAAAALMQLGTDYRFKTTVEVDVNNIQAQKLKGNLYIRFSGDPTLTTEDLKILVNNIKKAGIQSIIGDIILDGSKFTKPNYALGWSWDSLSWGFSPPVTAIILDENQIPFVIKSNPMLGQKAQVCLQGGEQPIKMDADLISVSKEDAENQCQINVQMDEKNNLNIKGCWPTDPKDSVLKAALNNPFLLAKEIILLSLKKENIYLSGQVKFREIPTIPAKDAKSNSLNVIFNKESIPLLQIVSIMLQDSNNIFADSLAKTIGHEYFQKGTFQLGVHAIKKIILEKLNVSLEDIRIFDGSGISKYNALSPYDLSYLLFALKHHAISENFIEALPVGGLSGNLKHRFNDPLMQGRVKAKTGTAIGMSALAGYISSLAGEEFVFTIMIDHVIGDQKNVKLFENKLCELIVSYKDE